jgi:hypothetical protein
MRQLSPSGQQVVDDIARRHGISMEAALSMLDAVVRGNGSMAQFSHPEFGGSGQWMRGGMTMVSDMFNNQLKSRVDALCHELATVVASQPELLRSGSYQSQSQGGQEQFSGSGHAYASSDSGTASLFVPPPPDWWGPTLRWPDSTGSQNGVRYANFAQARRLAIEAHGTVTIYDTLDHQIGSFSQQQSQGGSLSFNSQYGLIDVASLPVISVNGVEPMAAAPAYPPPPVATPPAATGNHGGGNAQDIFATIERLAELRAKGVLDDAEFQAKKTELLGRL